jgi:hypothetical protein
MGLELMIILFSYSFLHQIRRRRKKGKKKKGGGGTARQKIN